MGTDTADCRKVAELIGVKTFTNEFIAYTQLKDLIANRHTLTNYTTFYNTTEWHWNDGDILLDITGEVLQGGVLSVSMFFLRLFSIILSYFAMLTSLFLEKSSKFL